MPKFRSGVGEAMVFIEEQTIVNLASIQPCICTGNGMKIGKYNVNNALYEVPRIRKKAS